MNSKQERQSDNTTLWIVLACIFGGGALFCCFFMGIALILPAIQQTREAARGARSQDNLRQQILTMMEYSDREGVLPPGGTADAQGRKRHGWPVHLLSINIELSALVSSIDLENSYWDDPELKSVFQQEVPLFMNPSVSETRTSDNLAQIHYSANEHLFFLNSRAKWSQITDGTATTIFLGEIGADYPAWASPENFRDPARGIGRSSTQFGHPIKTGCNFAFGDGSVQFLNTDIDPTVLSRLATPDDGEPVSLP